MKFIKRFWLELSFIAIIWIGYGCFVYSDPMAIVAFIFPLGLTAQGADVIGFQLRQDEELKGETNE